MDNIYITLGYDLNWIFEEAVDHAAEVADDIAGSIEDTIEHDTYEEIHMVTILVEETETEISSLLAGIKEILAGVEGVRLTVERD